MKIDVEGWDLKVLRGATQTIKKNRMAIITWLYIARIIYCNNFNNYF